jgi:hypothetical protein
MTTKSKKVMDTNLIFSTALEKLKSKFTLPTEGFLAGGSIANLIWEIVSGKEAIINDIDIFILKELQSNMSNLYLYDKFTTKTVTKEVSEDYNGIKFSYKNEIKYYIDESIREEIFNKIYYCSDTKSPQIIIDSFDLNCCQVGYDLSEKKFYWSKEFIEFLKTGEIKIIDLRTPAHTAIRLAKKKVELGATVNEDEFGIAKYVLKHKNLMNVQKYRFKEKNKLEFEKFSDILGDKFKLDRDLDSEKIIKSLHGIEDKIYCLEPIGEIMNFGTNSGFMPDDFMYYYRNIQNEESKKLIWLNLNLIIDKKFTINEYLDKEVNDDEIYLLARLIFNAPLIVKNIKGYTISKQLEWVNTIIEKFKHDLIIAISVIEKNKLDLDLDLDDDMNLLLLELSVRKNIITDSRNKVGKIFRNENDIRWVSIECDDLPI